MPVCLPVFSSSACLFSVELFIRLCVGLLFLLRFSCSSASWVSFAWPWLIGFACLLVSRSCGGVFRAVFWLWGGAGVSQVGQIA